MTATQLLICWIMMAGLTIITRLLRDEVFSRDLLAIALLAATAITALAAIESLAELPGVLGAGIGWLRLFLIFSIMIAALAGFDLRKSIAVGVAYATMITIFKALRPLEGPAKVAVEGSLCQAYDDMSLSHLLIRWIVVALLTIISGLWKGQRFGSRLLGLALLTGTAITGLAALYPLAKLPGLWGLGISWLQDFGTFTILVAVLTKFSVRNSLIMGFHYATLFAIYTLLK